MNASSPPASRFARRAVAREARDAFPPMGVYAIRDRQTDRVLVLGASRNVHASLNRARFELRMGTHSDRTLQAGWHQRGPDCFAFEVLELLKEREAPDFDYASELKALEDFHREALAEAPGHGHA